MPRYIGGDISIVQEVYQNRRRQQALAARAPDHPARVFGEAVEAEARLNVPPRDHDVERACEQMFSRIVPDIVQKLTDHIDKRFAELERKGQRSSPYALGNGTDYRPLSIPAYLSEKERAYPDFARIRKNFGPAFGALVAVLKQEALKMSGKQGNHKRHTESDRCVMDHAWEIATAYRESLLGRPAAFADAKPSILELLNRGAASL